MANQPYGYQVPTTIAIQQQPMAGDARGMQNTSAWSSGLCGCCEDCAICCCGFCFPWCLMCRISSALGEGCCITCCPASDAAMRIKFRTLFGIQGTMLKDYCTACFCGQCALCQLAREMKRRNVM